jgi:hypothetical protein
MLGPSAFGLVITPTFTANFNTFFGVNAAAAQASWIAAANVFQTDFSDPINVNITVDAVAGTSVFGQSSFGLLGTSYANFHNLLVADSKTANDATALGAGGSLTLADPTGGTGNWWGSRAEAKAIGLIPNDLSADGTTTFGAGNPFTFSGAIAAGTYDFQGVAAHEISEVLGRVGLKGATLGSNPPFPNSYSILDLFSYSGPGVRTLAGGTNAWFSINNGTTLLKLYNNWTLNNLDSRDWASGNNDSFNQFAGPGVVNPVTPVDLQELDVIGYDLMVPEPSTFSVVIAGLAFFALRRFRARA